MHFNNLTTNAFPSHKQVASNSNWIHGSVNFNHLPLSSLNQLIPITIKWFCQMVLLSDMISPFISLILSLLSYNSDNAKACWCELNAIKIRSEGGNVFCSSQSVKLAFKVG